MTPAEIITGAIPTSLGKLYPDEWRSLWRQWVGDRGSFVRRLGPGHVIDGRLGDFPLTKTRKEALDRVDVLICREARHRAAVVLEPLASSDYEFTCSHCDDAWPFDPARLVFCPDCDAVVGGPCLRPSGHPLFAGHHHATREPAAMAAGLLQRCKAAPALQVLNDQPALF